MKLTSVLLVVLASIFAGCAVNPRHQAVEALLQQRMANLDDGELLRGYYELKRRAQELGVDEAQFNAMSNRYNTSSRINRAFGARRSANEDAGAAIATAIIAGIANAQRDAVVTKALEARVELELRGWTPVLGFTRATPRPQQAMQYIERAPTSISVPPQPTQPVQVSVTPPATPLTPVALTPAIVASPTAAAAAIPVSTAPARSPVPCYQMMLAKDGTMQCAQ
jgi:hypothetical protein